MSSSRSGQKNANAAANQPPVLSFLGGGGHENGKPVEGHADFSAVLEAHVELLLVEPDIRGRGEF